MINTVFVFKRLFFLFLVAGLVTIDVRFVGSQKCKKPKLVTQGVHLEMITIYKQ